MKWKKLDEANWKEPKTTYYFNKDCFIRHPDDEINHQYSKNLKHPNYLFKKGSTWTIVWKDTDLETNFIALTDGKVERFVLGEDLEEAEFKNNLIKSVASTDDILRFTDEKI